MSAKKFGMILAGSLKKLMVTKHNDSIFHYWIMTVEPIDITVHQPVIIKAKQPMIVPYLKTTEVRPRFDLQDLRLSLFGLRKIYGPERSSINGDFTEFRRWLLQLEYSDRNKLLELHFEPTLYNWGEVIRKRTSMLHSPKYATALYFVAGNNFHKMTGHPTGTEFFVINNEIYRRLTWRGVTMKFWDSKKRQDTGILWKTATEYVYFLYKCGKINEEPMKSNIIDTIGMALLERDRPK